MTAPDRIARRGNKDLKKRLDSLCHEISQIKAALALGKPLRSTRKAALAWKDLMSASEELSEKWSGPSAVEEIRTQRER